MGQQPDGPDVGRSSRPSATLEGHRLFDPDVADNLHYEVTDSEGRRVSVRVIRRGSKLSWLVWW